MMITHSKLLSPFYTPNVKPNFEEKLLKEAYFAIQSIEKWWFLSYLFLDERKAYPSALQN